MSKKHNKKFKEETRMAKGKQITGITAYCMRCKAKRAIRDPRQITHPNGRAAVTGVCSACGTKIFRMGNMPEAVKAVETVSAPEPASESTPEPASESTPASTLEREFKLGDWGKKRSKVKIS